MCNELRVSVLFGFFVLTAGLLTAQDASTDPFEQRLQYKKAYEDAVSAGDSKEAITAAENFAIIERIMVSTIKEQLPDEKELLKNSETSLLGVLLHLVNAYEDQANYAKASELWKEIIPVWENVADKTKLDAVDVRLRQRYSDEMKKLSTNQQEQVYEAIELNEQAQKFIESKQWQKAHDAADESMAILTKVWGADNPMNSTYLNTQGLAYYEQDDSKSAEQYFRKAVAMTRIVSGEDSSTYAIVLENLARSLVNQGRIDEAEKYYTPAIKIRRAIYGDNDPVTIETIEELRSFRENK